MTFLKHLQGTKFSELTLLDFAYVVVLLPLAVMLKAPMILFSIIVLLLLLFKRTPASNALLFFIFFLGGTALYLSLYGAFSFSGLSRLKLFLELLVYVLLIVVSLQRLTRKINLYLLISPFLFLALSLFFYHSILMLIYVVFELFVLLWLILSQRMNGDVQEGFKTSMLMFMYSLPWVVVLFIFFPRISFEHANYGFKGEVTKRMGHDGTMYLDGNALLVPSDRIVMEVGFEGEVPKAEHLYFRGSILYVDKKDHWEGMPNTVQRETKTFYPTKGIPITYQVTLYPTQKKWLYTLDMPSRTISNATLNPDLITTIEKPIKEPLHYEAYSSLSPSFFDTLDTKTLNASSAYNIEQNPHTYKEAQKIKASYSSIEKRAVAVTHFFRTQDLTYTLQPDPLDINHTTDSFLFDTHRGYCVHFASSFVTMARMTGIPARIVTGYRADPKNGLKHYLAVKEKDAHAWVELYIKNHWVRFESTATASSVENNQKFQDDNILYQKINLYLMYVKYQVETWILHYSHIRQLQLLDYVKKNPSFIFTFVLSFIVLIISNFLVISYFKRPNYSSKALETLRPLLRHLKKQGYVKKFDESMHQFFLRYLAKNSQNIALQKVDALYEEIVYNNKSSNEKIKTLKKAVKESISLLQNKKL